MSDLRRNNPGALADVIDFDAFLERLKGQFGPPSAMPPVKPPPVIQTNKTGGDAGFRGVMKAEGGDYGQDYCVLYELKDGTLLELPERYLRAGYSEAFENGHAEVLLHPKSGGQPSQGSVDLSLSQIEMVLRYLEEKLPFSRPYAGPQVEI